MKNLKNQRSNLHKVLTILMMLLYCSLSIDAIAQAQYKFTNKEGVNAKDIHIKFNRPVIKYPPNPNPNNDPTTQSPSGTFPLCAGGTAPGTSTIDMGAGAGAGVPPNGSITLTFNYSGNQVPTIVKWWWTSDGDVDGSTGQLGVEKKGKKNCFSFGTNPSTGNGAIELIVDNTPHTFNVPPGLTGDLTATAFEGFVNAIPFAVAVRDNNNVSVTTNAYGDGSPGEFSASIISNDATQNITLLNCDEEVHEIPTLSQWGLIIFGSILMIVGVIFIVRRRRMMNV